MTTDKCSIGTTTGSAERSPAEDRSATVARTADLVGKLTSLADRYDAAVEDGDDTRTSDRRQRVAALRSTAESGRRLIRSLAPAAPAPLGQGAPAETFAERRAAQVDREPTAPGGQAGTYALVTRLARRAIIRQAQGILMERAGMSAEEAFEALMLAAAGPLTLDGVADHVVRRGELPPRRTSPDRPRAARSWRSGFPVGSASAAGRPADSRTGSPPSGSERWRDGAADEPAAVPASVIEHAGLGIVLLGLDGVAFQANPAFCRILGCSEDHLLSRTFAEYTHPDDVEHDLAQFTQMVTGGMDLYRLEKRYLRHDGGVVWCALTMSAARGSGGELLFAMGIVEDVTEQRQLREQLQDQAMHDHLTRLPNRRLFDDRFAHAQRLARRQEHRLAVIVLDLDGFKAVNDTLGHPAGDEVLVAVAATLAAACRESDTVARVGGDEFAVLCEGPGAADHALALAERLRTALAVTLTLRSGAHVSVSASVGFAVADVPDENHTLLRRADAAMYRCKDQEVRGRGA